MLFLCDIILDIKANNFDASQCELPYMPVLKETVQSDPGTENPFNRNLAALRNSITFEERE